MFEQNTAVLYFLYKNPTVVYIYKYVQNVAVLYFPMRNAAVLCLSVFSVKNRKEKKCQYSPQADVPQARMFVIIVKCWA